MNYHLHVGLCIISIRLEMQNRNKGERSHNLTCRKSKDTILQGLIPAMYSTHESCIPNPLSIISGSHNCFAASGQQKTTNHPIHFCRRFFARRGDCNTNNACYLSCEAFCRRCATFMLPTCSLLETFARQDNQIKHAPQ